METFTKARPLVENPNFAGQREAALRALADADLDEPLKDLIADLNRRPCCFTLQCCWGHFLTPDEADEHTLAAPPARGKAELDYKLAYVAFCVSDDDEGRALRDEIRGLVDAEPRFVQFGSADWFWERQVNSYAIQVAPRNRRKRDRMILDGKQARLLAHARTRMFREFAELLRRWPTGRSG